MVTVADYGGVNVVFVMYGGSAANKLLLPYGDARWLWCVASVNGIFSSYRLTSIRTVGRGGMPTFTCCCIPFCVVWGGLGTWWGLDAAWHSAGHVNRAMPDQRSFMRHSRVGARNFWWWGRTLYDDIPFTSCGKYGRGRALAIRGGRDANWT